MDGIIELGELLDWYGPLLTERQQSIMAQYTGEDCSLSEIAEREGISRQGVHDTIVRAGQQLKEYESCLGLVKKNRAQERLARELNARVIASRAAEEEKKQLLSCLAAMESVWKS